MTYPPPNGTANVQTFMARAKALLEAKNIPVPVITSGGTPSMMMAGEAPVTTEYRAGTYVYNDRSLVERGVCGWDDCALTVLATVVSVPTDNRAIIDAGSKTLTSDLMGLAGYGHVLSRPEIRVDQLSEEHGRLSTLGPINLGVGRPNPYRPQSRLRRDQYGRQGSGHDWRSPVGQFECLRPRLHYLATMLRRQTSGGPVDRHRPFIGYPIVGAFRIKRKGPGILGGVRHERLEEGAADIVAVTVSSI